MRHNKRRQEQEALRFAYEGACDALRFQYTKKFWNKDGLSSTKAKKIWKQALKDTGKMVM